MADPPPFDPSKPFEEVGAAPAFDPSKPFQDVDPSAVPAPKNYDWSDVPGQAFRNIPSSAVKFGTDLVHPFIHPIQTAESIKNLGMGILQKYSGAKGKVAQSALGEREPGDYEKYADAVGQFFVDRYGSVEGVKRTLAEDPVGAAADVATVLSGGELALARAPGVIGKTGQVLGQVGRAVDPLSAVGLAAKGTGHLASEIVGDVFTHTGKHSIDTAFKAGKEGGAGAEAFKSHMRESADMADVVSDAQKAVARMKAERGAAYRADKVLVDQDPTILSFNEIDAAINAMEDVSKYRGRSKTGPAVDLRPETKSVRENLIDAVDTFRNMKPSEYHTVEGFDALKRMIGSIRDKTKYGTPERKIADEIYHAAKDTIVKQAPGYSGLMKAYEEASDLIRNLEQTLTGAPKTNIDSSLRRLTSIFRKNVNTNFGYREHLAKFLVNSGATHLMEKIAGQALSAGMPRGVGRLGATAAAELGLTLLGHAGGHGLKAAALAGATIPLMSPRLMGEAAYGVGRAASLPWKNISRGAFQVGRESQKTGTQYTWPSLSPWN